MLLGGFIVTAASFFPSRRGLQIFMPSLEEIPADKKRKISMEWMSYIALKRMLRLGNLAKIERISST